MLSLWAARAKMIGKFNFHQILRERSSPWMSSMSCRANRSRNLISLWIDLIKNSNTLHEISFHVYCICFVFSCETSLIESCCENFESNNIFLELQANLSCLRWHKMFMHEFLNWKYFPFPFKLSFFPFLRSFLTNVELVNLSWLPHRLPAEMRFLHKFYVCFLLNFHVYSCAR